MSQSNKIIAIVATVLVVAVLALALGSGSCSNSGSAGGGRASAGIPETSTEAVQSNESYEDIRNQLLERISGKNDPVGDNILNASEATSLLSTEGAYTTLSDRGFENVILSASFDIMGNYISPTELDNNSTEIYPSYRGNYISATGIQWTIIINAGRVFAVPIAAKVATPSKDIILSESSSITQYNGTKNEFSEFSFNDLLTTGVVGVTVQRIDATRVFTT